MNILSQILTFETKNFIIQQVIDTIKDFVTNSIAQLLPNFSSNRYISHMLNLQKKINDAIKEMIIKFINTIDYFYKCSDTRRKQYYVNKSNVPRTIYTLFGEIYFERTLYISKYEKKYYCFVDDILGIEKFYLYDPIVRGIAINDAINYNPNNASYHSSLSALHILENISTNKASIISRQSIYRWIRSCSLREIKYEEIDTKSTLYVMADEKWIHKQDKMEKNKKKWIMSKCFVIFTGIDRKKGRCRLLGKHVFITSSSHPYKELMDQICKIYNFEKVNTINLLSDAGSWILAGKSELRLYCHNHVVINTCEFHVKQKINRSTTQKDLREKLSKIIYEDEDKKLFINIMDDLINSKDKQSRKDKIIEYKNYIIKHWNGIIAMKYSDIKSSMESHISHCIASKFGSRPKAYSLHYIQTYLKLQEASVNGINILDYYLKCYNSDSDFKYNEKEVDFSIFDSSTSNLPVCTSKNYISKNIFRIAYPILSF